MLWTGAGTQVGRARPFYAPGRKQLTQPPPSLSACLPHWATSEESFLFSFLLIFFFFFNSHHRCDVSFPGLYNFIWAEWF